MNGKKCIVCGSGEMVGVQQPLQFQGVTSDCKVSVLEPTFAVCGKCGHVQKIIDDDWMAQVSQIYANYEMYTLSDGHEQVIFGNSPPMPRTTKLVMKLQQVVDLPTRGNLLDIGCGNGAFLKSFGKVYRNWSLAGFERDDSFRDDIMKIEGVAQFFSGSVEGIGKTFDVVTMIHVIEHVLDPVEMLRQVRKLMIPGGFLLIQTPSFQDNPFDMVVVDHCSHFRLSTLNYVAQSAGFRVIKKIDNWIDKEIGILAIPADERTNIDLTTEPNDSPEIAERSLSWLHKVVKRSRGLSEKGNLGIFGTAIAGVWLERALDNRANFFVDEDPLRQGKLLQSRPILKPSEVPDDASVFLAYPPKIAMSVYSRLKETYPLISFVMPPDIEQNGQWAEKRLGLGDHLESDSNIDMTMVDYYRSNYFNPVTISVEDEVVWNSHFIKRHNLYMRHLGIPLSFLKGRSVVEFGPNSGENALVLAIYGANLTLVEPNEQVLPRLKELFERFSVMDRVKDLRVESMTDFQSETLYHLAIAEGFLFTLPNRDQLVVKMASLLMPGGLGVISFNDRYGGLMEFTKKLVLWHACRLSNEDIHSNGSLKLAKTFFNDEFMKLNASRTFYAWWKDTMVSPFVASQFLWSFKEILPLLENANCAFHSSSPKWQTGNLFTWYKNVDHRTDESSILKDWRTVFPYILTGLRPKGIDGPGVSDEVIDCVADLVRSISNYTSDESDMGFLRDIAYPGVLYEYLKSIGDPLIVKFNDEMKGLYDAINDCDLKRLTDAYLNTEVLRYLWGTAYHYISFERL